MRKPLFLIGALAALAVSSSCDKPPAADTAAVGGAPANGAGPIGGTLIINPAADAINLFPPYVGDETGRWIQDQIFDRLAEINQEMLTVGDKGFSPRLAQKWTWSRDSLSIAFFIDPRARWHDGKPVTAADVRYSFNTFMDTVVGSPVRPLMLNIDSVTVRDSLTAVAWFKKRSPQQFFDLAYQLIIFPQHIYGAIPTKELRTAEATRHPIGTGRFRFVRWETGVRIELVADTANFRGRAKLDRLIFAPASAQAAAAQLLSGQSDFMQAFPVDQLDRLDASTVARGLILPLYSYVFMAMNPRNPKNLTMPHPIFADIRVRRAFEAAMDRQAMLTNVFGAKGRLAHGPFTTNLSFADSTIQPPSFDTTAAKAMLDSSGWRVGAGGMRAKNGTPLKFGLLVLSSSLFRKRYAVLIQEQLRKVGAQADIEIIDGHLQKAREDAGNFDADMASFTPDPVPTGPVQNWGTSGIGPNGQNFLHYSNRTVDAMLDSASISFDPAKVKSYMTRAFRGIVEDAPAVWLYEVTVVYGVNRRVQLAPTRPDEWWANLADWTIPVDKRIDRDKIGLAQPKP